MPVKNQLTENFETSVFNIEGLNVEEIKDISYKNILVNLPKERAVYGTGNTDGITVEEIGLTPEISEPPKRHLNIIGWPEEKSKRKQMAMELANKFTLELFEVPLKR